MKGDHLEKCRLFDQIEILYELILVKISATASAMKNIELEMDRAVKQERLSTIRILHLINCAEDKRTHLERGYSSLHDWMITEHKYSEGAANRRIQAARIMRHLPEIEKKLEEGILNLTTLAMAQSFSKGMTTKERRELVKQLENKSGREALKFLKKRFPDTPQNETAQPIDSNTIRLSVNVSNETLDKLQAIRDEMSHRLLTIGEVIDHLVAEKQCVIKKCSHQDPKTKRICGGTFFPQIDHIHPLGLGGSNRPENKRLLCRAHNILAAEHAYGLEHMKQFKKSESTG